VLISGPIASGKTTVAFKLAEVARERGLRAAALDMDDVVAIIAGTDWSRVRPEDRDFASRVAGGLANHLFGAGVDVIAVEGSTLASYEWDELQQQLTSEHETLTVRLRVSLAESIRRAQGDAGRVSTKNPDFVARIYGQIDWASLTQADLEIDTDALGVDEVVASIGARVFEP